MQLLKRILKVSTRYETNEGFLKFLSKTEIVVAKVLSLLMVVVVLVAIYDLGTFLFKAILEEPFGFGGIKLVEVFGAFLSVLIALEILENITAYLKTNVIQAELVITTSLIAVARKIIILDFDKTSGLDLIGLAIAVFALSISYWIIHQVNAKQEH